MSAMLASDENNPNFTGARNPDSALHVSFYSRPVQNNYKTQMQGHPIFEDVVYVKIHTPGNQLNVIDTPARGDHKKRFPLQWAHFQNTQGDQKVVGTPLTQWPILTSAQAQTLKGLAFHTVEQVAFASDEQISRAGMHGGMAPFTLRDRAKRYLEAAQGDAASHRAAEELKKRDEEIATLKKQMEELMAAFKPAAQIAQGLTLPPQPETVTTTTVTVNERDELAKQYESKFGKKPHHKMTAATLKEKLGG